MVTSARRAAPYRMLFNSIHFFLFFPLVTTVYFLLPDRARNAWLLLASCYFYMAFVPVYILILVATIVVDYVAGLKIHAAEGTRRRNYLSLSILINVGALAIFKYYGFVGANVGHLAKLFHFSNPLPALRIILPIGLSFHTFQAMSYTIEVYRRRQEPERNFLTYSLYVLFYPQLVAGPIERPQNLLHQFREHHAFEPARIVAGLQQMAIGLFKKVVIADRLAIFADSSRIWQKPQGHSAIELLAATVLFTFQIYYDFSGYSDIAIGAARVMGFRLMKNFDLPYGAASLSEFWRRWHISLSTWFRDYLYIPLGGNRNGPVRRWRNVLVVMCVSGLWHGANWTFALWGLIHGIGLLTETATRTLRDRLLPSAEARKTFGRLYTFTFVAFAWIFFRAPNAHSALYVARHLAHGLPGQFVELLARGRSGDLELGYVATAALLVGGMTLIETADRRRVIFERTREWSRPARYGFYFALVYGSIFFGQSDVQFIYFQF